MSVVGLIVFVCVCWFLLSCLFALLIAPQDVVEYMLILDRFHLADSYPARTSLSHNRLAPCRLRL